MGKKTGLIFLLCLLLGCSNEGGKSGAPESPNQDPKSEAKLSDFITVGPTDLLQIKIKEGVADPDTVLFRAQGYAEAKNRLLQMDMLRRLASGRLSEFLGEKALQKDFLSVAFGLRAAIDQGYQRIQADAETMRYLTAFAEGVNEYIKEVEEDRPSLVRQYRRLSEDPNYLPARWTEKDSVAIATSMAFLLSSQGKQKLEMFGVYLYFSMPMGPGLEKFHNLFDLRAVERVSIVGGVDPNPKKVPAPKKIVEPASFFSGLSDLFLGSSCGNPAQSGFPFPDACQFMATTGSNNWVVSKEFAGGDSALLCNDPHLTNAFPATFIELSLDSKSAGGGFKVSGVGIPGVPGILIGHNESIGWGMTNSMWDWDDVYYLSRSILNPNLVDYRGEKRPLVKHLEKFNVKQPGGGVLEIEEPFYNAPDGTFVISDHIEQLQNPLLKQMAFSYRWVGHTEAGTEIVGILKMNRATQFEEFKSAIRFFNVGSQNMVFADTKGNIGYIIHGKFPVRKYLSERVPPYIPIPGNGEYEWASIEDREITVYNPPSGKIVTANNDPLGLNFNPWLSDFSDYLGYRFDPGYRSRRIHDLLEANKGSLTPQVMQSIQYDHRDLLADRFLKLLAEDGKKLNMSARAHTLLMNLTSWDRNASRDSAIVPRFYLWLGKLGKVFYETKFFTRKSPAVVYKPAFGFFLKTGFATSSLYHHLQDLQVLTAVERLEIFKKSLEEAAFDIEKHEDLIPAWGSVHHLDFVNSLDGVLPKLLQFPLERDGTWTTVDMSGFDMSSIVDNLLGDNKDKPFTLPSLGGPSFRMTLAISPNGIQGWNVLPGGNKGVFDQEHAINELLLWRDGGVRALVGF